MEMPKFKYHPDPIASGVLQKSDKLCECCEKNRAWIYTASFYTENEVENICPWCIADGSAAKKFKGTFIDDYPLLEAGIDKKNVTEVCERTPGYHSWQQEVWQHHCNDACEFHGNATKEELEILSGEALDNFLKEEMLELNAWKDVLENYEEGGDTAIYRFKCRKCSHIIYTMDFS